MENTKQFKGYIKIENEGEMDINSLLLLGATSKRGNKDMIGYFGSGLKYAIAVLLKFGIPFKIFAGEKEIKVTTSKKNFRGKEFDVIKINNKLTSLTTEMGPDWEAWYAVREIYCNAIDEGNHSLGIADEPKAEKGKTIFYVSFDYQLAELFSNWNKFFSDKRNDLVVDGSQHGTKLFSGDGHELIIYRKGVRCHHEKKKCLYHYDLDWVTINESRIISSTWNLNYKLPQKIAQVADKEVIKNFFDNYKGTFEAELRWESVSAFNSNWLDVIDGRIIIIDSVAGYFAEELASNREKHLILPADLADALKNYFGKRIKIKGMSDSYDSGIELKMTERQKEYCDDAIRFLKKGGIEVKAPMVVYDFKSEATLGEAKNGEIRLSPKVFDYGKRVVVATVLEEASHLDSGQGDKTRAFQNYLFNRLIMLLEDKTGERL